MKEIISTVIKTNKVKDYNDTEKKLAKINKIAGVGSSTSSAPVFQGDIFFILTFLHDRYLNQ